MSTTLELSFPIPDHLHEQLMAELLEMGCEGFLQEKNLLKAYVLADQWTMGHRKEMATWLRQREQDPSAVQYQQWEQQNWNAVWEASIEPIVAGPFLVKPTWAPVPPGEEHLEVLLIDPKMSFGTGHHESTRLVLRFLPEWTRPGDRVLDAGTGTGVLAIATLRLGATKAIAFDIDPWVEENVLENFDLNHITPEQAEFREGSIEVVPETGFDLVLANINRNALLDMLPVFVEKLGPEGRLIMAGLLTTDRTLMLEQIQQCGLHAAEEASEGPWWSVVAKTEKR